MQQMWCCSMWVGRILGPISGNGTDDVQGFTQWNQINCQGVPIAKETICHAMYTQYTFCKYGRLGHDNKILVILCMMHGICILFPDLLGIYMGFQLIENLWPFKLSFMLHTWISSFFCCGLTYFVHFNACFVIILIGVSMKSIISIIILKPVYLNLYLPNLILLI